MAAVCYSSPSFTNSYTSNGNTNISVPLSRRRKVVFLYHSLYVSGPAFQWACENLLRPGYDHVTLLNTFTDEAFQIVDTKKLWKVAVDDMSVQVEYKKKLDRLEQELEIFRLSLSELDIMAQKIILPEGDSKTNIVNMAYSLNAELIIMSSNPVNGLQRAIYGSLEEYLLRHGPCSVVVAKPRIRNSHSTSPKMNPSSPIPQWTSPSAEASTAVGSPVSKPLSCFVKQSLLPVPQLTETASSFSDVSSEDLEQSPDISFETPPKLDNINKNTFGLTVETDCSAESMNSFDGSDESDVEASSLSAFKNQIEQYQSQARFEIDDSTNEWGLQSSVEPQDVSTLEDNISESSLSLTEKEVENNSSKPSIHLNIHSEKYFSEPNSPSFNFKSNPSSSNLQRKPSGLFKPPPPQPRVKSIIDNLPKH